MRIVRCTEIEWQMGERVHRLVHSSRVKGMALAKRSEDDGGVLPIVALVRRVVDASGLSVEAYALAHDIPRSTLNRYVNHLHEPMQIPPRRKTLQALSDALGVPLREVERAADASVARQSRADQADVSPPMKDQSAEAGVQVDVLDAIRRDPYLLPEARAHLENQYELLLRLQRLDPALLAAQERRRAAADLHAAADIEENERSLSELREVDTEREVTASSPDEPTPIHGKRPRGPLR